MPTARSLVVLVPVLLAASASAQLTHEATVRWSVPLGEPGVLSRTTAVDASGDARLDVFLRGGATNDKIVFFDGVWTGSGTYDTGVTCNDFAAAPGQGPYGIGALAFVSAGGLKLLARNALDSETFEFVTPTLIADGPWLNAKLVRTGDVDGTSGLDYVGVKADGRTLLLRANGGPTNLEVDIGRDILDVVLVNWTGSAAREIAVLSTQGVEIRSSSLTTVDGLAVSGHTSKAIAVLAVPNDTVDRLAWIGTKTATGKTDFALLKQATPRVDNLFELDATDTTASGIYTGDVDGDADTDVLITRTSTGSPWFLASATYSYTPWFASKVAISVPDPLLATGQPTLARFANDSTTELILPTYAAESAELELFASSVGRFFSTDIFQFVPDGHTSDPEALLLVDGSDPQWREVQFQLNFQDELLAAPVPPQGENRKVEVTVWEVTGTSNNVLPDAENRYWIDWPGDTTFQNMIVHDILFPLPEFYEGHCDLVPRFVEVRQIRVAAGDVVVEAGPTYTFGIARGELDYTTYWPPNIAHEMTDLLQTQGDVESHFSCLGQQAIDSPVHASAIVIRRKPNPVGGQGVPLPVPLPSGSLVQVQN